MFKQKESINPEKVDTIVGANTTIEGNIESQGTIRIEGRVKGDITVNGDIFVGVNALIKGNLNANNIHLAGTIEGNVLSTGVFKMLSTAKMFGDVKVKSFVADEGGLFQGKCIMVETDENDKPIIPAYSKKNGFGKDNKKNSVLEEVFEEKEKTSSGIIED